MPGAGRAAEEAASWFARVQGGGATDEDWQTLEGWLRATPVQIAAYERLESLWVELDDHAAPLDAVLARPVATGERARRGSSARRGATRRHWLAAAGGTMAAGMAAGAFLLSSRGPSPSTAGAVAYETSLGQTRVVALADGTRVRLNAGSRIDVRLDPDARRVVMADAEAVFDVAHDPARPFLIRVGDREVRVVGTEFNLRRRDGRTVLTVRRGVVEVRPVGARTPAVTRVSVGQQLVHVEASGRSSLAAVDPDEAFGWTSGQLIYRDRPLSEVAGDVGRRFGAPVRIADAETARIRFTGVLVMDDEIAVLRRLQAFAPVEAVRESDGDLMLRRRS